jgi:cell division protein FtsZ
LEREAFGEGEQEHPTISVIGCGGAGCNIVRSLQTLQIPGMTFVYLNHRDELKPEHYQEATTIPLEMTHLKAETPEHAEEATWRKYSSLGNVLKGSMLTFLVCGLGGTTGSGSAPAVAEIARSHKTVTVALTIHPFKIEGPRRSRNTQWSMDRLRTHAHGVVTIHNEKLMTLAPDISFGQALQVTNRMAALPIQEIGTLATRGDIKKVRHVFSCPELHIGFGGSDRRAGYVNALNEVSESMMPGPSLRAKDWDRGLITVRAGPDVLDTEIDHLVGAISGELHPKGKVLWGMIRDDTMADAIRVMAIMGKGVQDQG